MGVTTKGTNKMNSLSLVLLSLGMFVFVASVSPRNAHAYDTKTATQYDVEREKEKLKNVGIDKDKQGEQIDLELKFADESGKLVPLKNFFEKDKPVLLSMVYYECPGLCNFHMDGLVNALGDVGLDPAQDYNWLAISMDSSETPEMAKNKKQTYLEDQTKKETKNINQGWRFLTGNKQNLKKLTEDLGFSYRWDEETQQFAHASGVYIMTPEGKISNIISGIEFQPKTLRLTMVDAVKGKIGNIIDKVSLFCFQFDPHKNKYTVFAFNFMKIGGLLTVILILIFLGPFWYKTIKNESAKEK